MVGIFAATLLVHLFSTLVGAAVGSLIPADVMTWVAGLLFVGFGVWTLRGDTVDEDEAQRPSRFGPILTTAIAFFLAELGDKTQIMTMTIAANPPAALRTMGGFASGWLPEASTTPGGSGVLFGVWMGSTLGMVIADGLAIIVGSVLGKSLPERLITRISGVVFIVFGVGMIGVMYLR
jgi:putative Ca2+/H+ antiporter (TMEM165/GDT1 family)